MEPHIYFWSHRVEGFKDNNERVRTLYENTKIDKDKLFNKYKKVVDQNIARININPDDDFSDINDLRYELYQDEMKNIAGLLNHAIAIHKYQYLALLDQTWENELISFVTDELKNYYELKSPLPYCKVMEKILKKNIYPEKIAGLQKITELRTLVNVIKHGNGPAADKLRKKRPDFFKFDDSKPLNAINDRLVAWDSVLLDGDTLDVGEEEFYDYYNSINEFWDSLPTRVFLDKETIALFED